MKSLKIGALLVAAMAMMAVTASAASAATYTASAYPVTVEGTQLGQHVFTVDGSEVKCSVANFTSANNTEASESLTVSAEYDGCTAFGFVDAEVEMNSCDYVFNAPGGAPLTSTVSVACTGTPIEINVNTILGSCEVRVGAQNPSGGNTYTNHVEAGEVTIHTHVTGIKANVVKDSGICPLSGTGERTNATYVGNSIAQAAQAGVSIDVG